MISLWPPPSQLNISVDSGTSLWNAIVAAATSTPNGLSLSETNRATVWVPPGRHVMDRISISSYITVRSISGDPLDTVITCDDSEYTFNIGSGAFFVQFHGVTIENTGGGLAVQAVAGGTHYGINWRNCIFVDSLGTQDYRLAAVSSTPMQRERPALIAPSTTFDSGCGWTAALNASSEFNANNVRCGDTSMEIVAGSNANYGCLAYATDNTGWDLTGKSLYLSYHIADPDSQLTLSRAELLLSNSTASLGADYAMCDFLPQRPGWHCVPLAASAFVPAGSFTFSSPVKRVEFRFARTSTSGTAATMTLDQVAVWAHGGTSPRVLIYTDDQLSGTEAAIRYAIGKGFDVTMAINPTNVGYTGPEDGQTYFTWAQLRDLGETGKVRFSPHLTGYPTSKTYQTRSDYAHRAIHELLAHGLNGLGLSHYVIPAGGVAPGAGDNVWTRDTPAEVLTFFSSLRGLSPFWTGIPNEQTWSPAFFAQSPLPRDPRWVGCGAVSDAGITGGAGYTALVASIIPRIVAHKDMLSLYVHNVGDAGQYLQSCTLANWKTLIDLLVTDGFTSITPMELF